MKTNRTLRASLALALLASPGLRAEEQPDPAIAGLEKAAADFVVAYNDRKPDTIAALFTENGEMTDLAGEELITGREAIKIRYEGIFAAEDVPQMAIEVDSVRLVAPNLAVEDGTVHLTPPGDDAVPRSFAYTATLLKNDAGVWQIASTRDLGDATDAAGHLADLASVLKGEWTCRNQDGVVLDLAFGWDPSGKFLAGETLTTVADGEPQEGSIRISWNAARQAIVSWIFDVGGGVIQGIWTPTEDGWLVRAEGTTADGETITATQELTRENKDTLLWSATDKVIDGEKQPDTTLRIVRQAPDPTAAN
jgi:uncharacterized protein (TIGR02246 family)